MSDSGGWADAHKPIQVRCPYCDFLQAVEEEEVYVLFRRQGVCFIDCQKCDQTLNIDKEVNVLR